MTLCTRGRPEKLLLLLLLLHFILLPISILLTNNFCPPATLLPSGHTQLAPKCCTKIDKNPNYLENHRRLISPYCCWVVASACRLSAICYKAVLWPEDKKRSHSMDTCIKCIKAPQKSLINQNKQGSVCLCVWWHLVLNKNENNVQISVYDEDHIERNWSS